MLLLHTPFHYNLIHESFSCILLNFYILHSSFTINFFYKDHVAVIMSWVALKLLGVNKTINLTPTILNYNSNSKFFSSTSYRLGLCRDDSVNESSNTLRLSISSYSDSTTYNIDRSLTVDLRLIFQTFFI